jgi:hypothetical protein
MAPPALFYPSAEGASRGSRVDGTCGKRFAKMVKLCGCSGSPCEVAHQIVYFLRRKPCSFQQSHAEVFRAYFVAFAGDRLRDGEPPDKFDKGRNLHTLVIGTFHRDISRFRKSLAVQHHAL